MDDELHTLTENLFEEAYKMVDEAKGNKVVVEKKLVDTAWKIEAMDNCPPASCSRRSTSERTHQGTDCRCISNAVIRL